MTYLFMPSFHDYGLRGSGVPIRGVVVHMAEGGGTVGYLAKRNPNGVSVHYVIEYGGRIVQMLRESHVNGSINPREVRTTDDPPFTFNGATVTFGVTAAKRALGSYWTDPNRATIGIEIEGFAKDGPNDKQAAALVALMADIATRHGTAYTLGHRDFADYKACPGKRIDWASFGGHGVQLEEDMIAIYERTPRKGRFVIKAGSTVKGRAPTDAGWEVVKELTPANDTSAPFDARLDRRSSTIAPSTLLRVSDGYFAGLYVSTADVVETYDDEPVDCAPLIEAARKEAAAAATTAERERAQAIAAQAVTTLGGI